MQPPQWRDGLHDWHVGDRLTANQDASSYPQAVEMLLEREHQLAEAQRLAHLGSWVWDLASGESTWSDELYRVFGFGTQEFTPSYEAFFSRVHPGHLARTAAIIRSSVADGQPGAFECPIVLPDGAERWIRALCMVDVDTSGAPVRMHATAQDITDFMLLRAAPTTTDAASPGLYDPLTGVASWSLFADRASAALKRAKRGGLSTALLVIDLDHFRRLNDQLGRVMGDLVLVEVARRLETLFRPYDAVARPGAASARLGGDEFIILCEDVPDLAAAHALCRRIGERLESPLGLHGGEVLVTAGVGLALAPPGDSDVEDLIAEAQSALEQARPGRDDGARSAPAGETRPVDGDMGEAGLALKAALALGELRLYYQPKVDLTSDRIVGAEALLRWQHPQRGLLAPLEFIPLAEETGLIVSIGAWVIEEACREAERWLRSFPDRPALVVSVNVSACQFSAGLVDIVTRALSRSTAQPAALCLEITETILMNDTEGSIAVLQALADLGVGLSIDDFGTGYSSLAYLKRFPLHELKIDKCFVDGLARDDNSAAIVAAVVAMAHGLELRVVAEGVETAGQLQRLRTFGCEQAQGYHFARPGPPAMIDALLRRELSRGWRSHAVQNDRADTTSQSYRPDRILVVDDTADVRQLALMSLTAVGFEVQEAADGASALSAARLNSPDCVLLDVVMPGMSGLEVCRALRADPRTAQCTILMLTSNDRAADKVEAFSSGADDYIVKPFSPRDLASRVHAAMRRRREADRITTLAALSGSGSAPAGSLLERVIEADL